MSRRDALTLAAAGLAAPLLPAVSFAETRKETNPMSYIKVGQENSQPITRTDAAPKQEIQLERLTPEYWRVTLDNPPFNIFGPETIPQLDSVVTQIETDSKVKVVVFQSAVPGFFLTHYDFAPPLSATTGISPGATGLPALPDMLVRLSRAPVVSIVSIRGRATGVGSELSLSSDCASPAARRRSCRSGKSAPGWCLVAAPWPPCRA